MDFVASNAKILVVDDNKMSLKLAGSLISSLGPQVDSAQSGKIALSMLQEKRYHLVFMDYLMPEMDGIETVRMIRGMEDMYYRKIPVIALTGEDTPDMVLFKEAGMNDFLSKPLDKELLKTMLRKWLPKELILYQESVGKSDEQESENIHNSEGMWQDLEGIDIAEGRKNSGGKDAFISFLGDFYKLIDIKAALLEKCLADNRIREYTIEVHALKNSARMIGAMELSEDFGRMELLGKADDIETISKEFPQLLAKYQSYKPILQPYAVQENWGKKETTTEEVIFYLRGMQEAVDAFDMDRVDWAMERLEEFHLPETCNPLMEKLRAAVADVAMEDILVMSEEVITYLQE